MAKRYPRIKAFSLGAAVVDGDEDEDLDLDDVDLEDDDDTDESEEDIDESDDDESEESDDEDEDEEPAPSRAQTRFQKLANERKEAKAEALRLKQENDRLQVQFNQMNQQRANPQNDPEAVRAYLNALPPEQRVQAQLQIQMNQHAHQMQVVQFNMQDTADKSAFDAKAVNNNLYRKYAQEVETRLINLRREHNLNAPREAVLQNIIGELVLSKKAAPVSKKQSVKSIKKHTTTANSKKSDVSGKGRVGKTARERLEGVKF